jgi:uncharacterized protein YqgC (DUF456 family)
MIPCLSKTLFGIECLGCGFQRAFILLLKGEFSMAFQMYPAVYTTLIFLGFLGLHFVDTSKNYKKPLTSMAVINVLFMVAGYYYKHF